MRTLLCLLLMGSLTAQDLFKNKSQYPINVVPFKLTEYDLPVHPTPVVGNMVVEFVIDEEGKVTNPHIVDTSLHTIYNDVVLDKVKQMRFSPPLQNGVAVKVSYKLPILFK